MFDNETVHYGKWMVKTFSPLNILNRFIHTFWTSPYFKRRGSGNYLRLVLFFTPLNIWNWLIHQWLRNSPLWIIGISTKQYTLISPPIMLSGLFHFLWASLLSGRMLPTLNRFAPVWNLLFHNRAVNERCSPHHKFNQLDYRSLGHETVSDACKWILYCKSKKKETHVSYWLWE